MLRLGTIGMAWSISVALIGCGAPIRLATSPSPGPLRPKAGQRAPERVIEKKPGGPPPGDGANHGTRAPSQPQQFDLLQHEYAGAKPTRILLGKATYYSNELAGHAMASGETYEPDGALAAHRSLPFGTIVRVTGVKSKQAVIVRITDRGPYGGKGRVIDLSYAAARKIGLLRLGVADVRIEVLHTPDRH